MTRILLIALAVLVPGSILAAACGNRERERHRERTVRRGPASVAAPLAGSGCVGATAAPRAGAGCVGSAFAAPVAPVAIPRASAGCVGSIPQIMPGPSRTVRVARERERERTGFLPLDGIRLIPFRR